VTYDPEFDGTPIGSLGVFEHWNNATERKYSRNLGTGEGIELIYLKNGMTGISSNKIENISIAAPNPFSKITRFSRPANISINSKLEIYNMTGQLIRDFNFTKSDNFEWNGADAKNNPLPNGLYVYKIRDNESNLVFSGKVILKK
jgi:hypothetical protein